MNTNLEEKIEKLHGLVKTQSAEGNWNYSDYMRGMANGLLCAQAIFDEKDPVFFEAQEKYLIDTLPEDGKCQDE